MEAQLLEDCYLLQSWHNSQNKKVQDAPLFASHWNSVQEQKLKNELLLRGYSSKTIKVYCGQVERFYKYTNMQSGAWDHQMIQNYSLHLLNIKCSHAYVNQAISAIIATLNLKHKAILFLTYSSGLRVGEVVRLRLQDFDNVRKTLHIRQGKGRKDRLTLLSDTAFEIVQQYSQQEKPELFPGQAEGSH